jgi:hypothetical protein
VYFKWIFYIPLLVQGVVLCFDEFYFHIKRGLPRWERIGHPIDTFSVVLCLAYVLVLPYSKATLFPFLILAAFSCLLVTKDEFVHKEKCSAEEQWLHALLFLNHPLLLISIGWMWGQGEISSLFLGLQLAFASIFCIYQLVFWNLVWKEK